MAANAFTNKQETPSECEVTAALGSAKPVWDRFLSDLARECEATIREWKSYSIKMGWSLRVKRKSRTIVWLSPLAGGFTVVFILGNQAMQAAREGRLPQRVVKALEKAPQYPEGTCLRLEVKSARDLAALRKLAAIKLAN